MGPRNRDGREQAIDALGPLLALLADLLGPERRGVDRPDYDCWEYDDSVYLEAHLPGFSAGQIDLSFSEGRAFIRVSIEPSP